jgi:membrane associated rhomboid family serine protease
MSTTNRLLPHPVTSAAPGRLPAWDIPARMVATFLLVAVIMITTDVLGPQRSGLVASYPVILTVIGVFTLRQWGPDALLRVLRGISLSLLTFVGFFAVIGFAAPALGLSASYAVATATALCIGGALIGWNQRRVGLAESQSR